MDAAMKAYDHINGRWTDIKRFYFLARRLKNTACTAWCFKQLDNILATNLGDRPSTIICLVDLTAFHNDVRFGNNPGWFKAKYVPMMSIARC